MHKIIMQLHGGGGGGGRGGGSVDPIKQSAPVKQSAPGSTAVATIDNATEGERQSLFEKLSKARGRKYTNKTGGQITSDSVKKMLLGE